ncbi:phosphotransferase enzyme family protein [Oryzihumus sp.]|uniref:phosphotransferase enzyme family protein n=1 Tax=Oryzihumus sp. TaxID=1968903 RepID=UPI002EDA9573
MTSALLTDALRHWDLPPVESAEQMTGGANNTLIVVHAGGRSWVLRRYGNLPADRVLAEHRLLARVSDLGLPFAVPSPVPARDGATVVDDPGGALALFRHLPGRPLRRDEPGTAVLAGRALAQLDAALAEVPLALAPVDWRGAALGQVHAAVDDAAVLADELSAVMPGHDGPDWLRSTHERADAVAADLARALPAQVIHGDMAPANLLVEGGRVTAVLDFEIAGADLRATDLAAGLLQCTGWPEDRDSAERVGPFLRAYLDVLPLTPAELDAVPDLLRLRALGSLVWRAGRWRLGQSTLEEVRERLDAGLALEAALPGWAELLRA